MLTLFKNLDKYALQEDIITRGYAQYLTKIEELVKDIYIFALYSGCRASEILFLRIDETAAHTRDFSHELAAKELAIKTYIC